MQSFARGTRKCRQRLPKRGPLSGGFQVEISKWRVPVEGASPSGGSPSGGQRRLRVHVGTSYRNNVYCPYTYTTPQRDERADVGMARKRISLSEGVAGAMAALKAVTDPDPAYLLRLYRRLWLEHRTSTVT